MPFHRDRVLKILFLTAEAYPLIKVGGLGDYAGSLPKAIIQQAEGQSIEIDLRVAIPYHKQIDFQEEKINKICDISIPKSMGEAKGNIYELIHQEIPYYLIKRAGNAKGYDAVYNHNQMDDAKKFVFFSLACAQLIHELQWIPDILHANDWHTALAVKKIHCERESESELRKIKTLIVVHNLPFLGEGSSKEIKRYGICPSNSELLPIWARSLPLPIGLEATDQIVTVSPSYAKELEDERFSYGLAPFFQTNRDKKIGILNGIDHEIWDPVEDKKIDSNYSIDTLDRKNFNKIVLLGELGLSEYINDPLIIMISRLTDQKGVGLVLEALPKLLQEKWNAIVLGTGQKEYQHGLKTFEQQNSYRFRYFPEYNDLLAHRLYAAGDILLMPSMYEPCGLSQMIAMRYGCIPVARAVGGLIDSISANNEKTRDGYLFDEPNEISFIRCIQSALADFSKSEKWKAIQLRAMSKDLSWEKSALEYLHLYNKLVNLPFV